MTKTFWIKYEVHFDYFIYFHTFVKLCQIFVFVTKGFSANNVEAVRCTFYKARLVNNKRNLKMIVVVLHI